MLALSTNAHALNILLIPDKIKTVLQDPTALELTLLPNRIVTKLTLIAHESIHQVQSTIQPILHNQDTAWKATIALSGILLLQTVADSKARDDMAEQLEEAKMRAENESSRAKVAEKRASIAEKAAGAMNDCMQEQVKLAEESLALIEEPLRALEAERLSAIAAANRKWDEREEKRISTIGTVKQRAERAMARLGRLEVERTNLEEEAAKVPPPSAGFSQGFRPFAISVQLNWSLAANEAQSEAARIQINEADETELRLVQEGDENIVKREQDLEALARTFEVRERVVDESMDLRARDTAKGVREVLAAILAEVEREVGTGQE